MKDLFTDKPGVWNELKASEKPVVLYGMGDGADKVLAAFERFGIRAEAVMASSASDRMPATRTAARPFERQWRMVSA